MGLAQTLATSVLEAVGGATGRVAAAFSPLVADGLSWWYRAATSGQRQRAPKAHDWLLVAAAALVVAGVLVAAGLVLTRRRTERSLAGRISLVAVPTESFDPDPEEVLRLATQLARTRRAVHGLVSRRADAVRLRLAAVEGGRVVQLVEGPRAAEAVLRLGGYAEVELLPPETLHSAALVATPTWVADPGAAGDADDEEAG